MHTDLHFGQSYTLITFASAVLSSSSLASKSDSKDLLDGQRSDAQSLPQPMMVSCALSSPFCPFTAQHRRSKPFLPSQINSADIFDLLFD